MVNFEALIASITFWPFNFFRIDETFLGTLVSSLLVCKLEMGFMDCLFVFLLANTARFLQV